jgi:DNA-binding NtrC family response regulator
VALKLPNRTLLEKRGYIVTALEQGYQIANVVKRKTFDIIFLDSQTGGTRDSGLFAKFRKECPGCNIILMTSKRGDEFIREAMGAGAYGCINKPFNPEEVLTMVHHIIPRKKTQQRRPKEKKDN